MNRTVLEKMWEQTPTLAKLIKKMIKDVRSLVEDRIKYDKAIATMHKVYPSFLDPYIAGAKWYVTSSWIEIYVPFDFSLEDKLRKWAKHWEDEYRVRINTYTGTTWDDKPYAQRHFKISLGSVTFEITMDSRREGTTCRVDLLQAGADAVDPVMEIVCGSAPPLVEVE